MFSPTKVVFIFGAGASVSAGAPVMSNFFEKARKLISYSPSDHPIRKFENDFKIVFEFLSELQGISAKSYLNIDNLETLFGALEMGLLLGRFGEKKKEEIIRLKSSLISVIVNTLEHSMKFPLLQNRDGFLIGPPGGYQSFFQTISRYKKYFDYSFITFNYDLALDVGLQAYEYDFDYFFSNDLVNKVPLLKLHGSVNWYLEDGNKVRFIPLSSELKLGSDTEELPQSLPFYISNKILTELKSMPLIVPPSWNKTEYHNQLLNVWRKASEELSQAEYLFIVGYSLPDTDLFFKYLFALGTQSKTMLKKCIIINIDGNAIQRFQSLASEPLRKNIVSVGGGFEASNATIERELNQIVS